MAQKRGDELTGQDQQEAMDRWRCLASIRPAKLEWLRSHLFRVNGKGRLDKRARHCYPIGNWEEMVK